MDVHSFREVTLTMGGGDCKIRGGITKFWVPFMGGITKLRVKFIRCNKKKIKKK